MPPIHWTFLLLVNLVMILLLCRYQRQVRRFRKAAVRLDQLPLPVLRLDLDQLQIEKFLSGGSQALIRQIKKHPEVAEQLLEQNAFRSVNPAARKHWHGNLPLEQLLAKDQLARLIECTSHNSKIPLDCLLPNRQHPSQPQPAHLYVSSLHPNRHLTAIVVPVAGNMIDMAEIA